MIYASPGTEVAAPRRSPLRDQAAAALLVLSPSSTNRRSMAEPEVEPDRLLADGAVALEGVPIAIAITMLSKKEKKGLVLAYDELALICIDWELEKGVKVHLQVSTRFAAFKKALAKYTLGLPATGLYKLGETTVLDLKHFAHAHEVVVEMTDEFSKNVMSQHITSQLRRVSKGVVATKVHTAHARTPDLSSPAKVVSCRAL